MYIGSDSKDNPKYLGSGKLLQRAITKYGKDKFIKETIEIVEDRNLLKEREEYWLRKLNCAESDDYYNIVSNYLGGKTSSCFEKGFTPWNAGKIGKCDSLSRHMRGKKENEIYSNEALEKRSIGRLKRSETLRQKAAMMSEEERKLRYGHNKGKKINTRGGENSRRP